MSKYDKVSKNVLVRFMYNKTIKRNENFISVMIGKTGSGKSYSLISLSQKYQKYCLEKGRKKPIRIWLVFRYQQLLKLLIPKKEDPRKKHTIKRGDVVIYEEMGISADHRSFWSLTNKTIRYISQIARNRNFSFLMNLPVLNQLDKDVLPLVHIILETQTKIMDDRIVKCKIKMNQTNHVSGKVYKKYPYIWLPDKMTYKCVKYINFTYPKKEILYSNIKSLDEYEKVKDDFNNSVYQELMNLSNKMEAKEKNNEPINTDKMVKKIIDNKEKFLKTVNGREIIDFAMVRNEFGVGYKLSKVIKSLAEKKLGIGYHKKKT